MLFACGSQAHMHFGTMTLLDMEPITKHYKYIGVIILKSSEVHFFWHIPLITYTFDFTGKMWQKL